jgi:hypothetical protein
VSRLCNRWSGVGSQICVDGSFLLCLTDLSDIMSSIRPDRVFRIAGQRRLVNCGDPCMVCPRGFDRAVFVARLSLVVRSASCVV